MISAEILDAYRCLVEWKPQDMPDLKALGGAMYAIGDEEQPFFSEAVLYNLLPFKGDARSLLVRIRNLGEALAIPAEHRP